MSRERFRNPVTTNGHESCAAWGRPDVCGQTYAVLRMHPYLFVERLLRRLESCHDPRCQCLATTEPRRSGTVGTSTKGSERPVVHYTDWHAAGYNHCDQLLHPCFLIGCVGNALASDNNWLCVSALVLV